MNKKKQIVITRGSVPQHYDYSNADGRSWILEDGTSVSKGDKKSHVIDLSKYEVRRFVHTFEGYIISELKGNDKLFTLLRKKVELSPCKYYTITPKNYLYDDLGDLKTSILWAKPEFSYLDIQAMFAKEIKETLAKNSDNICIVEKRYLEKENSNDDGIYLQFNGKYYQILKSDSSEKDICGVLDEHTAMDGDGVIILTKVNQLNLYIKDGQILDEKLFEEISKNIIKLYTPIYDNESFLVWGNIPVKRFYAHVNIKDKEAFKRKAEHWMCDPSETELLVIPDILLLQTDTSNGSSFYIYRYTKDGKFAGETWYENLKDAMSQAAFEYEDALGSWDEIPEDVKDELTYLIEFERKN